PIPDASRGGTSGDCPRTWLALACANCPFRPWSSCRKCADASTGLFSEHGSSSSRPYRGGVARIPRCAFPDGSFHIGARGVAQMPIYRDDEDRLAFLRLLAVATARFEIGRASRRGTA